eukprot:GHRR01005432.1.p1 GENE.GHRR01005432.1~~GHRR01005432.1.p1  ORF type:complete len:1373 (+),score=543.66 GHRR01005432.1:373-4491(+)
MAEDSAFAGNSSGSAHSSRDKAFEIFVKRTITSIQKEAWGRSKEVKEIREACQGFLNTLEQNGCTEATLKGVLYPLQLACSSNMQKVVELALGCLHKLVAHAWLHGESTPSGTMDMLSAHGSLDDDDTVANVIKTVIKCGETSNEALQLAVVRALLTITTAEHFTAHGECLLAAVRAVFNLALGSENPINKRTACNALLQMLNTICKRVTQIQPRLTGDSQGSSRTASDAFEIFHSASFANHTPHSNRESATGFFGPGLSPTAAAAAALPAAGNGGSYHGGINGMLATAATGSSVHLQTLAAQQQQQQLLQGDYQAGDGGSSSSNKAAGPSAARAAQLAQLAEQQNLQGLEAVLGSSADAEADGDDASSADNDVTDDVHAPAGGLSTAPSSVEAAADAANAAVPRAGGSHEHAAAAVSSRQQPPSVGPPAGLPAGHNWEQQQQYGAATPRAPPTPNRPGKHSRLTVQEKDVLLVLTAFCKLASREAPGGSSSDSVLTQGKLLALEMLAKVLSNPFHNWDHVPEPFCRQLRQPLCLALLRNCAASDPGAYALALRLLVAIISLSRLRMGLRAELGAFYPLLVLRCLEQDLPEQANVAAALAALQGLLQEPQLLVDLYVNFDCDLQASNLYERTVQALSKLAQQYDVDDGSRGTDKRSGPEAAAAAATAYGIRKEALSCCLQIVAALETWAKPLKEATLRAAEADTSSPEGSQGGFSGLSGIEHSNSHGTLTSTATKLPQAIAPAPSEAERLAAAKSTKEVMAKGINLFNTKGPLKGIDFLMSQGLLESSPAAVASFLRAQYNQLGKAQLGDFLGHHDDFTVSVMHVWIDSEPSMSGQSIDQALRRLLGSFRLPGEAQKIDRIMEKFAEHYCRDNPTLFANADAAYVLSFAIIMLNTDAHNPSAERRLGKADFVAMNHLQTEEGGMQPVLPVQQLEEIYERVVKDEIIVHGEPSGSKDNALLRTSTRNRLAAAMGWTALLQPFKALAGGSGGGGSRDSSSTAREQRRYIQELAEREVARASASGNIWWSASHPEHARPMLQVGGPMLLQALSSALAAAPDASSAAPALTSLLQLAKLFGLLGLDRHCEACMAVLASRCGVFNPAQPGTATEAKQLAIVKGLLGLTAGPEAGFLGSSWVIVLRCVSALDALKHEVTKPIAVPATPPPKDTGSTNPFSRMFQSVFGTGNSSNSSKESSGSGSTSAAVAAVTGQRPAGSVGAINGLNSIEGDHDSLDGSKRPVPAIKDVPGAGLVAWAESAAGAMEMERPFTHSASLDGDGIIIFMRALCAVSQEELEAGSSSTSTQPAAAAVGSDVGPLRPLTPPGRPGPRLFCLQKVVECAYHNMSRIRLVWGKLWAVIAAQLVGASCHPNRCVK